MSIFSAKNELEGGAGHVSGKSTEAAAGPRRAPLSPQTRETQLAQEVSRLLREARRCGSRQRPHMASLWQEVPLLH